MCVRARACVCVCVCACVRVRGLSVCLSARNTRIPGQAIPVLRKNQPGQLLKVRLSKRNKRYCSNLV